MIDPFTAIFILILLFGLFLPVSIAMMLRPSLARRFEMDRTLMLMQIEARRRKEAEAADAD